MISVSRKLAAEAIGTALLLATVVGSGIMGERLSGGNTAIALLANSLATGTMLIVLILIFGPLSGAHFNPLVTLMSAIQRALPWNMILGYVLAQVAGAFVGVALANFMFDLPPFFFSHHERSGLSQLGSETVATFGLLATIWGCVRHRPSAVPFAVGSYIAAAYWFTASTSFANPAVTIARMATDTFAGIKPENVPGFIAAQCIGAGATVAVFRWLMPVPSNADTQARA